MVRATVRKSGDMDNATRPGVVKGEDGINDVLQKLNAATKRQVNSFVTGQFTSEKRIRDAKILNSDMYARGVRSRTIYPPEVRDHRATLGYVEWLNERGSEVRTMPNLPIQLLISDNETALLPLDPANNRAGILIYRESSVVSALQTLFELIWATASPLGEVLENNGQPILSDERALLELLALGYETNEIASALNVTKRTAERRISEIMGRLGTKSRFAAGVRAAKRFWL